MVLVLVEVKEVTAAIVCNRTILPSSVFPIARNLYAKVGIVDLRRASALARVSGRA